MAITSIPTKPFASRLFLCEFELCVPAVEILALAVLPRLPDPVAVLVVTVSELTVVVTPVAVGFAVAPTESVINPVNPVALTTF